MLGEAHRAEHKREAVFERGVSSPSTVDTARMLTHIVTRTHPHMTLTITHQHRHTMRFEKSHDEV